MMHKRINQILIVVLVILLGVYFFKKQLNTAEKCAKAAGIWNESEEICEPSLEQAIYQNLSTGSVLVMDYPESDKQFALDKTEKIDNNFYLRGHYEALLEEAVDDKEAVYDRASVYLNMTKMQLLSQYQDTELQSNVVYFIAPFVTQTAGSGVYVYVGLFSYDQLLKSSEHLDSVLLGDRVHDYKINLLDKLIRVDFLDYAAGQAFTDFPTEPVEMSLQLLNLNDANKQVEFKQIERMHSSWDKDQDGINDCESDGSCDHTSDYSKARAE
ncbi:MAG: hypothetical protein V7782_01310 [Psychromonas sp.]